MTDTQNIDAANAEYSDLLYGIEAIANYLNLKPRQVRNHIACNRIPTFKIGQARCARRLTLYRWLERQDRNARG
jgi:hypothetical protein